MDSILTSIKKLLGITADYDNFDDDIIMHINTVFMTLNQLGVGPAEGFRIEDDAAIWDDFIKVDENNPETKTLQTLQSAVKSYIHLKVKLLFDPPLSSAVMEAIKQSINELEWRLNIQAESE